MAGVVAAPRRATLPATRARVHAKESPTRDVATEGDRGVPTPPGSSKASQVRVPKHSDPRSIKRAAYRLPSRVRLVYGRGASRSGSVLGFDR